jgi:hypothetical protein
MIRKLAVVVIGVLVLGLVGCGQDEREAATEKESVDNAVEATKEMAGDATKEMASDAADATKEAAEATKEAAPDVKKTTE